MIKTICLILVGFTPPPEIPPEHEFPSDVKITPQNVTIKYDFHHKWDGGAFKVNGPQPEKISILFDGVPGNPLSAVEQATDESFINARRKKVTITMEFPSIDFDWKKLVLEVSPTMLEPENRKRGILFDDLRFMPGVVSVRNQIAKMGQTPGISVTFQTKVDNKYVLKAMKLCEEAKVPITIFFEK